MGAMVAPDRASSRVTKLTRGSRLASNLRHLLLRMSIRSSELASPSALCLVRMQGESSRFPRRP